MSNTSSIIIGNIPTNRGQYNPSSTYYEGNIVTYYSSQFSAKTNNFSKIPPLTVANDGTVAIANEAFWEVVTDNIELYNASLSNNNLSKRVSDAEGKIKEIDSKATTAASSASAASSSVEKLGSAVDGMKTDITNMGKSISSNTSAIESNARAIKALQLGVSPLTFECEVKNGLEFNFEDQQNIFQARIPFKILNGTTDITADSNTTALVTYPNGNVINLNGKLTELDFDVEIPGKYSISIKSTNDGRVANANFDIYIKAPIKMAIVSDEEENIRTLAYTNNLPAKIEFATLTDFGGTLRFYVPKYLSQSPSVSCGGIMVPTTLKENNIYWQLDYVDGVKEGTYNFTIN